MKNIIEKASARGATRSEVYGLTSLRTEVSFEANRLKGVSRTEERGFALRVVKDGRMGFATSTKFDDPDGLADAAVATAEFGDEAAFGFAGPAHMPEIGPSDERVKGLEVDDMMGRPRDAIARLLDYDQEILCDSETTREIQTISVATSDGLEASFERTLYQFGVDGRLIDGTSILDCGGYYGGTALDSDGQKLVSRVIEDLKNGRKNVDVTGGPTTVLFTPNAVADIFMTLHYGVSGSIVERGISPLAGKLGETVFDERVTIHDDGLARNGYASGPFDDEGVPMQRTPVVERGVLKHFLTDLRTAAKLRQPLTGNAGRARRLVMSKDLGKVPSPEITNWEMSGGDAPHEQLVDDMGDGIIVDRIMGILMSNLLSGDFSGNVALGYKVQGGKIRGRVKDTMVAGSIYTLLRDNVVAISSDVERVGQLGFIGSHRYPYLLMRDVSISA
ncbi:MAG: TldD/PmbA family protein [Candidatus Eisenbacteria bacterium]